MNAEKKKCARYKELLDSELTKNKDTQKEMLLKSKEKKRTIRKELK